MARIEPFTGRVTRPEHVAAVVTPAHDALTDEQRRHYRDTHPLCYLHVTRSAADEHDADTVDDLTLVTRGRDALERLLAADVFAPEAGPRWLVYELETTDHRQRGLVCEIPAEEFSEHARPHEGTQPERAALLAEHFLTVRAASSPVACTMARGPKLSSALSVVDGTDPLIEHRGDDGLVQRVWALNDPDSAAALTEAVTPSELYIIDGHHRAEANRRLLERGVSFPVLVAIFPPEQLRLAGFHRLLRLPDGLDEATFAARVERRFRSTWHDTPFVPAPGGVAIRVRGAWLHAYFDERPIAGGPIVRLGSLDPSITEREIIRGLGSVDGEHADVTYMPDEDSIDAVVAEADRTGRIPVLVPPVTVADMVEVADGGLTMPPKSTYFTPKVRAGLFLRTYP